MQHDSRSRGGGSLLLLMLLAVTMRMVEVPAGDAKEHVTALDKKFMVTFHSDSVIPVDVLATPARLYPMRLSNGSAFVCALPPGEEETTLLRGGQTDGDKSAGADKAPRADERRNLQTSRRDLDPRLVEHLQRRLQGKCYLRNMGWWTYQMCWNSHVRQMHLVAASRENDVTSPNLKVPGADSRATPMRKQFSSAVDNNLGVWVPKGDPTREETKYFLDEHPTFGKFMGVSLQYGMACDIDGSYREVEIRLFCAKDASQRDGYFEVNERGTCKYVVSMWLSQVCVAELQRAETRAAINCYPFRAPL